jgi:hypothetical protein
MSVDQTGSVFLQDGLELIDCSDKAEEEGHFFYHELFTPYLINKKEGN